MPREQWKTRWKDYYKILEVDPEARSEVIVAAYRKLALLYHPDPSASTDDSRMKEINEAKEVLLDSARRTSYDQARRTSYDQAYREGQANPAPPAGGESRRGPSSKDKGEPSAQRDNARKQAHKKAYNKLHNYENKVGRWVAAGQLPNGTLFTEADGIAVVELARKKYDEFLFSLYQ